MKRYKAPQRREIQLEAAKERGSVAWSAFKTQTIPARYKESALNNRFLYKYVSILIHMLILEIISCIRKSMKAYNVARIIFKSPPIYSFSKTFFPCLAFAGFMLV